MALSNALNFAGRWHIVDWVITVAIWIAYFIISSKTTPYHSDLLLDGNNMPLGHTYSLVDESVPDSDLILYSILLPGLVILATHALQFRRKRIQAVNDAIGNICGLLLGCGANLVLTETLKMVFGQPRPNFAALCKWSAASQTCTGSSKDIKNAYSSFPSAHASLSFCGLVYLSLSLAYYWSCRRVSGAYEPHPPCNEPQVVSPKVYVSEFQQRPADSFSTIISALLLSPIWLACYISVTRVVNKYHFTVDILAGSVIGTGFAFWAASCKLRSLWVTLLKSQAGMTDTNSDVRLDSV